MNALDLLRSVSSELEITFGARGAAVFSPCRLWRFALLRSWDSSRGCVAFVGLNPSTADQDVNDPTVRRCIDFAARWGFGSMFMLNAYGFRSTDPGGLVAVADPVGAWNGLYVSALARGVDSVVVAWGNHCSAEHQATVLGWCGRPVLCFDHTKSRRPKHPLYVRADQALRPFQPEKE